MKSAIIFITVLSSTVDLIFSDIRCYGCAKPNHQCSDPVLRTCHPDLNYCHRITFERGSDKGFYRCIDYRPSCELEVEHHVCNICEYDGCNKQGNTLRQCYQCYNGDETGVFTNIRQECSAPKKVYCGVDQQCMWATGRDGGKPYYGCTVLPATEVCKKYKFDNCRTCDSDLCNLPEQYTEPLHTCYECYTGDTASEANKYFRGMATCDNPSKKKCDYTHKCARGVDKIAGRKYYGCYNSDNLCYRFDFKACSYCDSDLCNEVRDYPSDNPINCYECYSGDKPPLGRPYHYKNLANCSYPAIKQCDPGFKCLRAININRTTVYHGCVQIETNSIYGYDNITFCEHDLCNKVPENKTSLQCYECYSGDTNANTNNKQPCSKPSLKQCEPGFKCVEASSKDKKQRYFGCADGNKSCKELSGLDDCQFCEENECNQIKPIDTRKRVKCYDCYMSGKGDFHDYGTKPNCSNPAIITCPPGEQCASAYDKDNGRQFHGCVTDPGTIDCKLYGFSTPCDIYCKEDLCNPVGNVTNVTRLKKSSASAMSSSCLLTILFVFHAALYMHKT